MLDASCRRALLYARSSGRSAESIASQGATCEGWAVDNGYEIVGAFSDDGVSGTVGHESRPGLAAALVALEAGEASLLIVRGLDRLARDMIASEAALSEAWKAGAQVAEATSGIVQPDDDSDPSRKLIRRILAAVHEMERDTIKARLQAGRKRASARGQHIGGIVRYGSRVIDSRYQPVESERAVIARIHALRADGQTWQAIATALNGDGIPSFQSGEWFPMSVRRIALRESQDPSAA